jgi:hypothetical protein
MGTKDPLTEDQNRSERGLSRREFARRVALVTATAASGLAASVPLAETAGAQESAQQAAKAPSLPPQSQAEVDARIQAILGRYGQRLSDAQKSDLKRLATEIQKPLEKLRAYSLSNSDMPATVLKPIVERQKPPAVGVVPAPPKPKS